MACIFGTLLQFHRIVILLEFTQELIASAITIITIQQLFFSKLTLTRYILENLKKRNTTEFKSFISYLDILLGKYIIVNLTTKLDDKGADFLNYVAIYLHNLHIEFLSFSPFDTQAHVTMYSMYNI